jgi:hypothetical protein
MPPPVPGSPPLFTKPPPVPKSPPVAIAPPKPRKPAPPPVLVVFAFGAGSSEPHA